MKIKTLLLENFRGIRNLRVDFGGNNTDICGENGTGKTTIANAICWVLTDSPATGEKDFTPKTADTHNLDHRAVLEVETDSGEVMSLAKTYHEVWKKKRGSAAPEFSGHVTDYAINQVPTKKKEFEETLERITGGNAERTKLLMLSGYFAETLSADDRRRILFDVCGDVSDDAVLEEVPALRELLVIPGSGAGLYSPEERKKIATKERQACNKKLEEIPARIDELTMTLPEGEEGSREEIARKIEAKQAELKAVQNGNSAEKRRGELRETIDRLEAENREQWRLYCQARQAEEEAAKENAKGLLDKSVEAEKRLDGLRRREAELAAEIETTTAARTKLLAEFTRVRAEEWNEDEEACPTCGRKYDPERVAEMKNNFFERRANRLGELNKIGQQCSQQIIEKLSSELAATKDEREKATAAAQEARSAYYQAAQGHSYDQLNAGYEATPEAREIKARRKKAQDELGSIPEGDREAEEKLRAEIDALLLSLGYAKQAEETKKRIEELEKEKLLASAGLGRAERVIYLCEEFTRAKVRMVTDRINKKFSSVRWLLFREQINGGLKECCEPLIPCSNGTAVEYRSANTAAQVNAGMEIIKVLAQHYGTHLPVVVDRAESVCELRDIQEQTVRLIVSAGDKNLRIINK